MVNDSTPGATAPPVAGVSASGSADNASMMDVTMAANKTGNTGEMSKIFLQTAAAQGIAGFFAFAAMAITCHQVSTVNQSINQSIFGCCYPQSENIMQQVANINSIGLHLKVISHAIHSDLVDYIVAH